MQAEASMADLERAECWVILGSGSPVMRVVAVEGDNCVCEEVDDPTRRTLLPYWALRRLVWFHPSDLPFATDDPFGVKKRPGWPPMRRTR